MASNLQAEIAGYDLLPIVERDAPQIVGSFNGRFTREVPCPKCGGRTRFRLRLCDDGIQRAYCSHCAEKGLDAIAYIQWRDGVDFKTARAFWTNTGASSIVPAREFKPQTLQRESPPNATWQAKARAFAQGCAATLWMPAGAAALAYLRSRDLSDDTIKRQSLGYNPTMRNAPAKGWGLADRDKVTAVAGITIPREIVGELWAVNVRRMNPDGTPYKGEGKYKTITGSRLGLWGADSLDGAFVALAFGGEFDAMLAQQHAPDGVACVTFGGEGHNVGELWRNMLSRVKTVHVCMDNDGAGDTGVMRWVENIPQARRARVPQGKDLTEFAQMGGNVAAWLVQLTGLYHWQPPTDVVERVALATELQTQIVAGELAPDDEVRALARWSVCTYGVDATDNTGELWLPLAQ